MNENQSDGNRAMVTKCQYHHCTKTNNNNIQLKQHTKKKNNFSFFNRHNSWVKERRENYKINHIDVVNVSEASSGINEMFCICEIL